MRRRITQQDARSNGESTVDIDLSMSGEPDGGPSPIGKVCGSGLPELSQMSRLGRKQIDIQIRLSSNQKHLGKRIVKTHMPKQINTQRAQAEQSRGSVA